VEGTDPGWDLGAPKLTASSGFDYLVDLRAPRIDVGSEERIQSLPLQRNALDGLGGGVEGGFSSLVRWACW
jgi:hypothetical protein